MSSSAPIVDPIPESAPRGRARYRWLPLLAMTILWMSACSTMPARTPPPATPTPRPPPAVVPVTPVAEPAPAFVVLAPASYEQEKRRIRQTLGKNDREALAASEVGYYLDVLQGRLRQVAGRNVVVTRKGERLVLDLSRQVSFEPTGSQLGPGTRESMAALNKVLVEYRNVLVSVRVSPVDAASLSNPRLAEQRALSLARQFADAGVANKRIVVAGVPAKPGRASATRVELQLEPIVRP